MSSNAVGFANVGLTDHNGSPIAPVVGVEYATFTNNNLGRSYAFQINVELLPPAPEPSTMLMGAMGLVGLNIARRKARNRARSV